MNTTFGLLLAFPVLSLAAVGCDAGDSSVNTFDAAPLGGDATDTPGDGGTEDAAPGAVTILEGDWRAECTQAHPFVFDIQFRGDNYKQVISLISGASCADTDNILEIRAPFTVGTETVGSTLTTYEVDLGTSTAIAVVRSGASFFNSISLCGKSDWIVDQDVPDVAALCDDWLTFELFGLDGTNLFIGDHATGNGTSAATRPTAVDATTPFMRVN